MTVHAIGMPENDSERKAIDYLSRHLPADKYVIYHNLELPAASGLPYEYDLVVVGEFAVYAVEVKGYQGRIRGNAQEWELESGAIHRSPIPLSNKKAKILADRLRRHSALKKVWVQSIVVLTDDRVRVRLDDAQADRVLHLHDAVTYIRDPRSLPVHTHSIAHLKDRIGEAIYNQFRPLHRRHEIGDYRVLETIGKNNLYTLLLAEHRLIHTQGRFTLKVYSFDVYASPEARHDQQERLLRDANALHRLGAHPNIVRAHPPFPWGDNSIVLPLDWVEGYSLRGLLDTGQQLDFARAVDIICQVGQGLSYAHSCGVIHRDLHPDNIIVPRQGPLKLVNFDCARVEGGDMDTIATRLGRQLDQRYVAPEVWLHAGAASPASDLYALGTIFYELLTGQPPYQRIKEVFTAGGLAHLPTEANPHLPPEVDPIFTRMCAFYPEERYPGLEEAIADLQHLA